MKKKYFFAALAVAATLTSCNDFLDQKSASELSGEHVYNNEYFTSSRVDYLYGLFTTDRTYSQDLAVTFCDNTDVECVDGTYKNKTHNAASYRGWGNYWSETYASETKNQNAWNEFYGIVEQATQIIESVKENGTFDESAAQRRSVGQAQVLRAIAYRDLIRLWGDVPMKLEKSHDDLSNAYLPKTNRDVILDTLINDLTEAADNLPWVGDYSYTAERATKGYALALKAQLALTRAGWAIREQNMGTNYESDPNGDATYPTQRPIKAIRDKYYKIALDALEEIVASGKYNLNTSFHNLWYNINQLQVDGESMFEIPMGLNKSGEIGYSVGIRLNQETATFGYTNSTGHMSVTAKLLYDYEVEDTRLLQTVGFYQIRSTAGNNKTKSGRETDNFVKDPFALPCAKWDPRMMSDSWLSVNKNAEAKFGYGINYIMMRYAQVLLMYAECINELSGDPTSKSYKGTTYSMSAQDALRLVRERAYANNTAKADDYVNGITTQEQMFNALVNENELEFAGEGVRKWELIRWNLLGSKILETRNATLNRSQTNPEGNTADWDAKLAYNYLNATDKTIDNTSLTIGQHLTDKGSYNAIASFAGTSSTDNTNNAKYFCGGLIGDPDNTPDVKNRYLLPLSTSVLSASGGMLQNSYGY